MSERTELIERLKKIGVHSEADFAEVGGALVWISEDRDQSLTVRDWKRFEIQVHFRQGPEKSWDTKIICGTNRHAEAMDWAEKHLRTSQWVAGIFSHAWQTKDTKDRVLALLGEKPDQSDHDVHLL